MTSSDFVKREQLCGTAQAIIAACSEEKSDASVIVDVAVGQFRELRRRWERERVGPDLDSAENGRLREALIALEWSQLTSLVWLCPRCGSPKTYGRHAPLCLIGIALGRSECTK